MNIVLNGKKTEIEKDMPLLQLLQKNKIAPELVACELNFKIIKRNQYAQTILKENDQLEILQMIGGG